MRRREKGNAVVLQHVATCELEQFIGGLLINDKKLLLTAFQFEEIILSGKDIKTAWEKTL